MVCGELVENSRVQYPHCDVVDSDVAALEHEEAVLHHSEAHKTLRVATICILILVEYHLAVVLDRVVFT